MLKPRFEKLTAFIDIIDQQISTHAEVDQKRWNALEPARFDTCTTYRSAVTTLKTNYVKRLEKLSAMPYFSLE